MKNILIIAPHPDDEVVGAHTIMKRILKQKNKVVFFLTNGVVDKNSVWFWDRNNHQKKVKRRISEMKKCINSLGIRNFYLQNIPTRSLKNNIEKTYSKILNIKKEHNIDTIFCPTYEGGHQDHDVANFICSRLKDKCKVYEFAEYNFFRKKVNSNHFLNPSDKDSVFFLSESEKKEKKDSLDIYNSEKSNLNYISFEKESYREIFDYDYKKPPHEGTLFYRRFSFFSWHPRVDSDNPDLICEMIINSEIF